MRWLLLLVCGLTIAGCGGSSSTTSSRPAAPGSFTDIAGRFSAQFPVRPKEINEPASVGGTHLTIHVAACAGPDHAAFEVESSEVKPAVPAAAQRTNLIAALKGVTTTSKLLLDRQPASVRFRGASAERATYAVDGQHYEAVAFFHGTSRFLMILAPTAKFSSFAASVTIT